MKPVVSGRVRSRDLFVRLDRSAQRGVGRQLEEQLREALRAGTLAPGADLPSTRALAEDLSVSRGVVARTYSQLAAEGYLEVRQGAPTRVRAIAQPSRERRPRASASVRYDLRAYTPDLKMFPRRAWGRSLSHALAVASDNDLGYLDDCRGLEQLRSEICSYLGRVRGVVADPALTVVTTGSTHTLSLLSRVLARRGVMKIGFENPSHRLFHAVASAAGLTPVGIPVDKDGLQVDALGREEIGAVMVSPSHQFPTGAALANERRSALIAWAIATGGLIIEDDYDAEFRYDKAPSAALQSCAPEQVAYIGSTGKTLAPGIRLGWAILPAGLVAGVSDELLTTCLQISGIDQLALADFLRRGELDRHLRRMRSTYRFRREVLIEVLAEQLPHLTVTGIPAGLHISLELASPEIETEAFELASARGLALETLARYALPGHRVPPGLVFGFGNVPEPSITPAMDLLAQCIRLAEHNQKPNLAC